MLIGVVVGVKEWLDATTNGQSIRAIATRAGIPISTLARQIRRGTVTADNAVAIARAYEASPVRALAAAGIIDEPSPDGVSVAEALVEATDDELASELARRERHTRP